MKLLALAVLAAPALALAADPPPAPADAPAAAANAPAAAAADPMAGWKPPQVRHQAQDRKEILALWKAFDDADRKGDLAAATALLDFPVLMVTDDAKGQGMGAAWTQEQWAQVMAPFYKNPDPKRQVTHRPEIFLMSDSLATVGDTVTVKTGGKKLVVRNSTLLVRRDGKWRVKAMTEGGWGDLMAGGAAPSGATAPSGAQPPPATK